MLVQKSSRVRRLPAQPRAGPLGAGVTKEVSFPAPAAWTHTARATPPDPWPLGDGSPSPLLLREWLVVGGRTHVGSWTHRAAWEAERRGVPSTPLSPVFMCLHTHICTHHAHTPHNPHNACTHPCTPTHAHSHVCISTQLCAHSCTCARTHAVSLPSQGPQSCPSSEHQLWAAPGSRAPSESAIVPELPQGPQGFPACPNREPCRPHAHGLQHLLISSDPDNLRRGQGSHRDPMQPERPKEVGPGQALLWG